MAVPPDGQHWPGVGEVVEAFESALARGDRCRGRRLRPAAGPPRAAGDPLRAGPRRPRAPLGAGPAPPAGGVPGDVPGAVRGPGPRPRDGLRGVPPEAPGRRGPDARRVPAAVRARGRGLAVAARRLAPRARPAPASTSAPADGGRDGAGRRRLPGLPRAGAGRREGLRSLLDSSRRPRRAVRAPAVARPHRPARGRAAGRGAVAGCPGSAPTSSGFRLCGELGRGAFGRVFLARQGDLADRLVALKVSADVAGESHALAQLQHTNIVPIYSVHRRGPLQAVCMPYLGSTTLADTLASLRSQADAAEVGRGAAQLAALPEDRPPPRRSRPRPGRRPTGRGRPGRPARPPGASRRPSTPRRTSRRPPRSSGCAGWATSRRCSGWSRGWPTAWPTPTSGASSTAT